MTTGFTAIVNGEMNVGTIEETVTVTGASPVVDTQNVIQQTTISRAALDALPTPRRPAQFITLIPAANAGGTNFHDVGGAGSDRGFFGVHGQRPDDMTYNFGGMDNRVFSGGGFQYNAHTFEEVVVQTAAGSAESSTGGVRRVVFASSREVYGEPIELPVDEGQPLLAINFYGASKVVGEAYCRAFRRASGLDTVILRLANAYGPRDYGRVIPLWIDQAAQGQDLHVYGGKQVLDFVWVEQVVQALISAGAADVALPPINVGSGTGTKLMDLARRIRLLSGGRGQIQIVPARPVEVVQYVARVDRMRSLLGIEPPADPLLHLDKLVQSPVTLALG